MLEVRELKPREWDDVARVTQLGGGEWGLDLQWGHGTSKPSQDCPVCPGDRAA